MGSLITYYLKKNTSYFYIFNLLMEHLKGFSKKTFIDNFISHEKCLLMKYNSYKVEKIFDLKEQWEVLFDRINAY